MTKRLIINIVFIMFLTNFFLQNELLVRKYKIKLIPHDQGLFVIDESDDDER